ncbi:ArsR/SmtB family transcription factor [Thermodesulforhabdus norvegica]|uniref:ArsR family transcriptional regulator n=1 Tax=Thermodesulforhabdus norvegica TaxID=39841 RepID=A0A1I4VQD8_9BACT|nr:metalloregulator ArsR/SmtB family transcription factor [Thermodesulforhabdus norvegica]SFN03380.1 ArsR family transcriptional regulator [Thermodesulforhabdus norvegica]
MPVNLDDAKLEAVAAALKSVAHPARLKILNLLAEEEQSVSDLCRNLDLPQPYVSQQLTILRNHGIIAARREGQQVFYRVLNPHVLKIMECVRAQAATEPDILKKEGNL